jgi:hypothetical protein
MQYTILLFLILAAQIITGTMLAVFRDSVSSAVGPWFRQPMLK